MKVSELKVLLRDVSQPVKYSSNECCPWICDFVSINRFTEHTWQGNEESPRAQVGAIAGPSYIHFYLHKFDPCQESAIPTLAHLDISTATMPLTSSVRALLASKRISRFT